MCPLFRGFTVHTFQNAFMDTFTVTHYSMGGSKTSTICCSTPRKENEEKWATASSNCQCFSSTYELRFITKWVSSSPLIHFLLYAQHAFKVASQGCEASTRSCLNDFLIEIRKTKEGGNQRPLFFAKGEPHPLHMKPPTWREIHQSGFTFGFWRSNLNSVPPVLHGSVRLSKSQDHSHDRW